MWTDYGEENGRVHLLNTAGRRFAHTVAKGTPAAIRAEESERETVRRSSKA